MRCLGLTPRLLQSRWEKAARRYEHARTRHMADFSMRDPENWALTREELFPLHEVPLP